MSSGASGSGEPSGKRARAVRLQDGPRDIKEFMAWPQVVVAALQRLNMIGEAVKRLASLQFISDYSGFGMMEMAVGAFTGELRQQGMLREAAGEFHSACDINACCRKVLSSFPDGHGPACVGTSAPAQQSSFLTG